MKNLLFGLIATVLFSFTGNAQDIEMLKSSKNPFNNIGESSFNFLIDLTNLSLEEGSTKQLLENKIKNSQYNKKLELSEVEIETYKVYFSKNSFNLNSIIKFEDYILGNDFKFNKDNLLKSIALVKWNMFFISESGDIFSKSAGTRPKGQTFGGCFDHCMVVKLYAVENSNWIDQTEFILGQPESTAYMVASCAWDCR